MNLINPADLEKVLKSVIPVLIEEARAKLIPELSTVFYKILDEYNIEITFVKKVGL